MAFVLNELDKTYIEKSSEVHAIERGKMQKVATNFLVNLYIFLNCQLKQLQATEIIHAKKNSCK